jgi:hypothetical protein
MTLPSDETPPALQPEPTEAELPRSVEVISLVDLLDDRLFALRDPGDVAGLAVSIARVGQRTPIDVRRLPAAVEGGPSRFQVICGFRRVAALKMLKRERVAAWVHPDLADDWALVHALATALEQRSLDRDELEGLSRRLDAEGRLGSQARGLIEIALNPPGSDLTPEEASEQIEEVDLDELSASILARLGAISADLAMIPDFWSSLEAEQRAAILEQLRYQAELHAYLSPRD